MSGKQNVQIRMEKLNQRPTKKIPRQETQRDHSLPRHVEEVDSVDDLIFRNLLQYKVLVKDICEV